MEFRNILRTTIITINVLALYLFDFVPYLLYTKTNPNPFLFLSSCIFGAELMVN